MKKRITRGIALLSLIALTTNASMQSIYAEVKDNVGGMDTTGTASADDVLDGETAWVNGEQIIGTMPNRAATNIPVSSGGTYDIAKGYYNGSGKVTNDISGITGALNNLSTATNDKFDLPSPLNINYAGTSTYSALVAGLNSATTAIKNIADKDASKITINQGGQKAIVDGYYHNNSFIENDISNVVGSVNALNSKVNDTFELTDSAALSTTYANNLTYTDLSGAIDETASAIENNNLAQPLIIPVLACSAYRTTNAGSSIIINTADYNSLSIGRITGGAISTCVLYGTKAGTSSENTIQTLSANSTIDITEYESVRFGMNTPNGSDGDFGWINISDVVFVR